MSEALHPNRVLSAPVQFTSSMRIKPFPSPNVALLEATAMPIILGSA